MIWFLVAFGVATTRIMVSFISTEKEQIIEDKKTNAVKELLLGLADYCRSKSNS